MHDRLILAIAALLAASGVALGAYAAHGLAKQLEALGYTNELDLRLGWFETGVRYQLYHALGAMIAVLIAAQTQRSSAASVAPIAFFLGTLLFCGSLYAMTFAPEQWRKLGAVVPLGGISFIVGWIAVAYGAWKSV